MKKITRLFAKISFSHSKVRYWSNSKVADYIRYFGGVDKKPSSATLGEWSEWRRENEYKLAYKIADDWLDSLQNFILFPKSVYLYIKRYIKNRFIDKLHCLDTKLSKGEYYDLDTRILYGVFEALVDFVEIEKSHMHQTFVLDKKKTIRSREYGIEYLDWEISLGKESPEQAKTAQLTKELYIWWKDERPNRTDPDFKSGWAEFCEKNKNGEFSLFKERSDEEKQQTRELIDLTHQIEEDYFQEDQRMLHKLISIRRGLWT